MSTSLRKRAVVQKTTSSVVSPPNPAKSSKSEEINQLYYPIGKAFLLSIPFPLLICLFSWFLVSSDAFPLPRIPFLLFTHIVLVACNAPISSTRRIHAFSKTLLACTFILSAIHNIAISHTIHSFTPAALTTTYSHITPDTIAVPSFLIVLNNADVVSHPAACILAENDVPCAAKPLLTLSSWTVALTDTLTPSQTLPTVSTTPSASADTLAHLASLSSLLSHTTYSLPLPSRALAYMLANTDTFQRAVLAGLALSWLGDVFLLGGQNDVFFLAGLGAFLFGHVGYVFANVSRIEALDMSHLLSLRAILGFAGILAFSVTCLRWLFNAGNIKGAVMKIAVPAYVFVITSMLLSAYTASVVAPLPATALHTDVTMHYSLHMKDLHISTSFATHSQPLPVCDRSAGDANAYDYYAETKVDPDTNEESSYSSSTMSASHISGKNSSESGKIRVTIPKILPALTHTLSAVRNAYDRVILPVLEPYFGPWMRGGESVLHSNADDKAYSHSISREQLSASGAKEADKDDRHPEHVSRHPHITDNSVVCLSDHTLLPGPSWQALLLLFGGFFFAISDVFVANEKFVHHTHINRTIGLAVYFYAQILISASLRY